MDSYKEAIKKEREFERTPSFALHRELGVLWKKVHQEYLASRSEEQKKDHKSKCPCQNILR